MSAVDSRSASRHAVARAAAERRKKLILIGLAVVFVALLAFELPKLLKGSGSSSSTTSTPTATTTTPATGSPVSRSLASTSSSTVAVKRVRAIRHMSAKDPFVPLIREQATTTSSLPSSSSASSSAPASTPAPVTSQPAIQFTPPAQTTPAVTKPVHVKPAAPSAAVIWTNGQRQVVGIGQVFTVGDAQFRLLAITKKAMRVEVVGGNFAGGKHALKVRKGHRVKLANTATGTEYRLLFTRGTTAAPTVVEAEKTPQATESQPSSSTQSSESQSTSSTQQSAPTTSEVMGSAISAN